MSPDKSVEKRLRRGRVGVARAVVICLYFFDSTMSCRTCYDTQCRRVPADCMRTQLGWLRHCIGLATREPSHSNLRITHMDTQAPAQPEFLWLRCVTEPITRMAMALFFPFCGCVRLAAAKGPLAYSIRPLVDGCCIWRRRGLPSCRRLPGL